jgi:hypothetical protein
MKRMGKFCKAYPVGRLREYGGWPESAGGAGGRPLADDDYLFVQEDLTVTDGIFLGEHEVFGDTSPGWAAFCADVLKFKAPAYEPGPPAGPDELS